MTDRELLEKAAKAAWIPLKEDFAERFDYYMAQPMMWNPLDKDGDALRLAVKLRITVTYAGNAAECFTVDTEGNASAAHMAPMYATDPYAATRRAIVRAAAAMVSE